MLIGRKTERKIRERSKKRRAISPGVFIRSTFRFRIFLTTSFPVLSPALYNCVSKLEYYTEREHSHAKRPIKEEKNLDDVCPHFLLFILAKCMQIHVIASACIFVALKKCHSLLFVNMQLNRCVSTRRFPPFRLSERPDVCKLCRQCQSSFTLDKRLKMRNGF